MTFVDFHHDDEEEIWPSDEEDNDPMIRPIRKNTNSTDFWTNGSIHVWNLEGDHDDDNDVKKQNNQSDVTDKQDKKKKRNSKGRQLCLV